MAIHLPHDAAPDHPDLSRLDVAIRLKAGLIHKMATSLPRQWPEDLAAFVSDLAESGLQDKTALLVLLAEVRQELRTFAGITGSPGSDVVELFDAGSGVDPSVHEILARFQQIVAKDLQAVAESRAMPDLVRRAMRFIEDHYVQPISVAQIAAAVGRSQKHVGALFRRHAGTTVHKHLVRVRLRHAVDLIRQGEKIEVVSLLVGYRSKKNFYRHFRAHMGVTPSAYRAAAAGADHYRGR